MAYASIAGLPAFGFSDVLGEDCHFARDEDAVAHLEGETGPAAAG
jgi:hypothetical protein